MTRAFLIFGILIFFINCKSTYLNEKSEFERYVSIHNEINSKQEKFTGEVNRNINIYSFEYKTDKDSLRSLKFEFNVKTNQLFFNRAEFYKLPKKSFTFDNQHFQYFRHKTWNEGLILFNKKYGVLALSNLYGPNLIFLQEEKRNLNTEKIILKILNE